MTTITRLLQCKFLVRLNGAAFGCHTSHIQFIGGKTVITLSRAVLAEENEENEEITVRPTLLDPSVAHLVEVGYGSNRSASVLWRFRDARLVDTVVFDGDSMQDKYMYETLTFNTYTTPFEAFCLEALPYEKSQPIPSTPPNVSST